MLIGTQKVTSLVDPESLSAHARFTEKKDGTSFAWLEFCRQDAESDATWLLPQGLYFKIGELLLRPVNCMLMPFAGRVARDPRQWVVLEWYYNGVVYETADALRAAMQSPGFSKVGRNMNGAWTQTEDFDQGAQGRDMPPPLMIHPTGNRFKLDKKNKFISWMGFEFYISTAADMGISLHAISFDDESILYEVGLQEALTHYAGDNPRNGGLEFLDTLMAMGLRARSLVPGYDCPAYAEYLSAEYHTGFGSFLNRDSICIFEYAADHALTRHTSDEHVTVSRNTYLVARSVSTMDNYDFTFDYIFYLDGTIEVKMRASGFIWGNFWDPNSAQDEYGYKVHDAAATSMHDYVLNFKADLDVAGTENSFVRVAIEPFTKEYPWDDEETKTRRAMHLVEREMEEEGGLDWPRNAREMYIVRATNKTNAWGEKRGYRIMPGTGVGIHRT